MHGRQELEENVGIYLDDNYEQISVPVPHFGGSDPADIIHDFHRVRAKGPSVIPMSIHTANVEYDARQPFCARRLTHCQLVYI